MDRIEATRKILAGLSCCKIIIATQNRPAVASEQAKAAKPRGFVSKSHLTEELVPVIQRLIATSIQDE